MRTRIALLTALVLAAIVAPQAAAYNILALGMGGYWNNLRDQFIGAQAGYGTPGLPGERWYTMASASDLASIDLRAYDVFLVQSGFTDDYVLHEATAALEALSRKRDEIRDFVGRGGGLVAWAQPLPDRVEHEWDWAPVQLVSSGVYHENLVAIEDLLHPIVAGSTDESLSHWQSSWHGWYTQVDPRLSAVVRTGDYGPGDPRTARPLTLAGAYQGSTCCGRMVFSLQDPDFHAYQQAPDRDDAARFIRTSLDWAAGPCRPIPEPSTIALLGLGLAGAAIRTIGRRR